MIDPKTTVYDDSHYTQMNLLHLVLTKHESGAVPYLLYLGRYEYRDGVHLARDASLTLRFVLCPEKKKMSDQFFLYPQEDLQNHKNFDKISGQESSSQSQYKIYFPRTCFPISGIGKHVFSNFPCQSNFESWSRDHAKLCSRFVLEKAWCGIKISITRNDI